MRTIRFIVLVIGVLGILALTSQSGQAGTSPSKGVPGRDLLLFSGAISSGDSRLMAEAIEEDCERIDWSEW